MGRYKIYALTDPMTHAVRYVGKAVDPEGRREAHMGHFAARRVRQWVANMRWGAPGMSVLEETDDPDEALLLERKWIAEHLACGALLLNLRDRPAENHESIALDEPDEENLP